jgi:hypothetical protein
MMYRSRIPHLTNVLLVLALALTLLLAACGSHAATASEQVSTATPVPTATATATVAPTATATPAPTATTPAGTPVAMAALPTVTPSPTPQPTATPQPTPTPVPRPGLPVRLVIPSIKVDAAVEHVGLTSDGDMDVPKDYHNVAWYQPGPRPGEQGNAAIDGHVDSKTNTAVFWDLRKLKPGDDIIVIGDDGVERHFVVKSIESYTTGNAPLQRIFGSTTGAHLNLITCDQSSTFNRSQGGYASRLVVYTDLVP